MDFRVQQNGDGIATKEQLCNYRNQVFGHLGNVG
jgi:hypothetical protein